MRALLDVSVLPPWANGLVVIAMIVVIGYGAHWVVEAASAIAKRLGISELVIGLTIVALGTSAPEFAVTIVAAFQGHSDISVGNIVGSNIFNLGFILGGCALVRAIPTHSTLLKRDGLVLAGAALLVYVLIGWDLRLNRYDGVLLALGLVVYLVVLFRQRRAGDAAAPEASDDVKAAKEPPAIPRNVLLLGLGLVGVVGGSHMLVESASTIARHLGVSEWVIGVTIVAAGTSTPELAASLAGVIKGRYALSAGSIIGSDIFNLFGVLGVAGILRPMEVAPLARVSLLALFVMVLLVLLFMRTGWRLSRLEGAALVVVAALRWAFDFLSR